MNSSLFLSELGRTPDLTDLIIDLAATIQRRRIERQLAQLRFSPGGAADGFKSSPSLAFPSLPMTNTPARCGLPVSSDQILSPAARDISNDMPEHWREFLNRPRLSAEEHNKSPGGRWS